MFSESSKWLRFLTLLALLIIGYLPEARAQWVRQDSKNKEVIVFVHGLMGDPEKTWGTGTTYWPKMLLKDRAFDREDIYVYKYHSAAFSSSPTINQLKTSMWSNLEADGVLKEKKLIFVCHSMGGVVTRALVLEHQKELVPKIAFIYFFATPGSGASLSDLAKFITKNPQFREITPLHEGGNPVLDNQISSWRSAHLSIKSYCGYETKRTLGVIVVSEESAIQLCTEPQQAFEEDHSSIVKPVSQESESYRALKAALEHSAQETPFTRKSANRPSLTASAPQGYISNCPEPDTYTYTHCTDSQVGQWAIDEAKEIDELAKQFAYGSPQQHDSDKYFFNQHLQACCAAKLTSLRTELMKRLGPTGADHMEEDYWSELSLELPTSSATVSGVMEYAKLLRKSGLTLKRRVIPREGSINLKFTELRTSPGELQVLLEAPRELHAGYIAVVFDHALIGASTDFATSKLPDMDEVNDTIRSLQAAYGDRIYVLQIGDNPFIPQAPISVFCRGADGAHVSSVSWIDE